MNTDHRSMRYLSFMNEFIVGLFVGLAVGMVMGMFCLALLAVSKNNDLEGGDYEETEE
jgi:hypothetical protein